MQLKLFSAKLEFWLDINELRKMLNVFYSVIYSVFKRYMSGVQNTQCLLIGLGTNIKDNSGYTEKM